jgi:hypothetical protein
LVLKGVGSGLGKTSEEGAGFFEPLASLEMGGVRGLVALGAADSPLTLG